LVGNSLGYLPAIFYRFPGLTISFFNRFAYRFAHPIFLLDNFTDFIFDLTAVLLRWHWAVLGALDGNLLGDVGAGLASGYALFPLHQAAAGSGHIVTSRGNLHNLFVADLL